MRRREFIAGLGGGAASAVSWPVAARAQQRDPVPRIGVLSNIAEENPEMKARLAAFVQGLERRGWSQDRIRIEGRFGVTSDQLEAVAAELVALKPLVILAGAPTVVATVKRASRGSIPVVFVAVSDPIGAGFISSLARPGGNLTGLMNFEAGITGKWAAMLKEIMPSLSRVAVVGNPHSTDFAYFLRALEEVAPSLGVQAIAMRVINVDEIERAIPLFAQMPGGGLVFPPDSTTISHRDLVIDLAARYRLPAVYPFRFFVTAGGLMSYATDLADQYRQAAAYVDQILRGANPADLPVQAPAKYETVVNLKAAKAIGLSVPPSMLVRADEVIE